MSCYTCIQFQSPVLAIYPLNGLLCAHEDLALDPLQRLWFGQNMESDNVEKKRVRLLPDCHRTKPEPVTWTGFTLRLLFWKISLLLEESDPV